MPVATTETLTLYQAGWQRPRTIPVSDTVVTARINEPPALSAIATVDDIARLGLVDVIGAWCFWEHPTQGPFAFRVDDDPSDLGNGSIALTGTGLGHALLMDRTTSVLIQPDTGHAGALARRAMSLAQTADPLPFRSIQCDESGPTVLVEWRGEAIYDVIADVTRQTNQEWDVLVDRERNLDLILREQIGEDKRDRVLISEGYQVATGRIDHSLLSVTNDITGISVNEDWERSANARIENETSRARYGRRQAVRRYENAVSALAVTAKVRSDIRREAVAPHLPTITLPAMHPVCLNIRHGDTIRYWSRSRNRELDFRVYSRTIRGGTLELAGIAQEVAVPPVVPPFAPDLLSGLRVWLDAQDRDTLTLAGDNVTRWLDKSPSQLTFVADGNPVTYIVSGFLDGRPVVSTSMAAATIGNYIGPALDLSGSSAVTVFAVARRNDVSAAKLVSFPDAPFGSPTIDVTIERDGGDFLYGSVRPAGMTPASYRSAATWGSDYHLVTYTVDLALASNEPTLYDSGVASGFRPTNGNNAGPLGSGWLMIGPRWNVAELLLYSRILSASERAAVEDFLRGHWGIA